MGCTCWFVLVQCVLTLLGAIFFFFFLSVLCLSFYPQVACCFGFGVVFLLCLPGGVMWSGILCFKFTNKNEQVI